MKVSELIARLEEIRSEHGNIPIRVWAGLPGAFFGMRISSSWPYLDVHGGLGTVNIDEGSAVMKKELETRGDSDAWVSFRDYHLIESVQVCDACGTFVAVLTEDAV